MNTEDTDEAPAPPPPPPPPPQQDTGVEIREDGPKPASKPLR